MNKFKGIYTALLTPFDKCGKINEKALEKLVRFNIEKGVDGFYVGGSTAEAFLMSADERKYIYEIVKGSAKDKTLIAHVGSLNEMEAINLAKHAEKLGYDAISSVSPFYYKFSFDEIKEYYMRIASATSLGMIVYNFPAFSGVNLGINEFSQFLDKDEFIGVKHTSNDYFLMEQIKSAYPHKVIYNGYDEMFMAGLSMGADGGIGSTYNFMADKFVAIRSLFEQGMLNEAQKIQKDVNKIVAVLCRLGVMQTEKEVLNQLGLDMGECRKPFGALTDEQKQIVKNEILPIL